MSVIIPVKAIEQDDNIIDKPHNGKSITKLEVSPNYKYLVTYSQENNSIVGWNVEDINEGQLKSEITVEVNEGGINSDQIRISDDKKLAYINYGRLEIIDMNNKNQEIKPYFDEGLESRYCIFNLKNELILYSVDKKLEGYIWIYSTQIKNNKWIYKRIYQVPREFEFLSISKYDKLYMFSQRRNAYDIYDFYEWDILTEKSIRIFVNKEEKIDEIKSGVSLAMINIKITSNEKFICLRVNEKIFIYSVELEFIIASLDINNDIQLYNFMNHLGLDLYPLLPSLFDLFDYIPSNGIWDSIIKHRCRGCLGRLKKNNESSETTLPDDIQVTDECAFGILDGYVSKIKFENKLDMKFLLKDPNESNVENEVVDWNAYFGKEINKETYEYLNVYLFDPYLDTIYALFQEATANNLNYLKIMNELTQNSFRWIIDCRQRGRLFLQVFKKDENDGWSLIGARFDLFNTRDTIFLYGSKLFDNNDIVLLTRMGLFIYHVDEDNGSTNKSISCTYFYSIDSKRFTKNLQYYKKILKSKSLLLPNYDSFKLNEWALYVKNNKSSLLKYGTRLFIFAIKERKAELVEDIYKTCIDYFKQDLNNNRKFISIISSTMPLLNEYYPEYIKRYSLETNMIIDSCLVWQVPFTMTIPCFYKIEHQDDNLHLYSFSQKLQVVDITLSEKISKIDLLNILWTKYNYLFNIISEAFSKHQSTSTITFMISYIKFVNYPQEYNWFWELIRPKSSAFVKVIDREIYETWSGEALINFKWNTYGKYYYAMIWILFMSFLGCFTLAAIPPQYFNYYDNHRKPLLIASIILGFIHLSFEVRQFTYNPKKWISDFWNFFDIIAYLLPTFTSIYWLQTNDRNGHIIELLSFSCLFLDLKFVIFFRAFESFGIYFAIIISVGKQIIYFLFVLLIIIISFAHAFFILLSPRTPYSFDNPIDFTNNDDEFNPWNVASMYKIFNNVNDGTIESNQFIVQQPDDNTNMFANYGTSLFAMYLFLTGDSSALTNWSYRQQPSLVIMMVLFSLLIVVYLMNLFIGLLNMAIEKDKDRVSYLIQKAEVLADIELFYLLPHQRRWKTWFPEVIYYNADVDKTREKVKEMIKEEGKWNTDEFPDMKQGLLDQLNIKN